MLTESPLNIRCAARLHGAAMQRLSGAHMWGAVVATIGQRIRYIRKTELGMGRQSEFAELIGVSQSTISRWENDEDTPDQDHIDRIAGLSRRYDNPSKLRHGDFPGFNGSRRTPLVLAERIIAAERNGLADPSRFAVSFLDMLQTKPRETAVPVEDAGLEEVVPQGGLALVDLDDRDLEDGAPCLADVDGQAILRIFRNSGGVIRFEPRTRQKGYDAIYPMRGFRILGRIIRLVAEVPRTLL